MDLATKKQIFNVSWEKLRKIGETKFVSSMYIWIFLVPFVVKVFEPIKNNEAISLVIFRHEFIINISLPFSWKVFYFSALCLALANFIIKVKCPKIIIDHLSYQSFLNEGKTKEQLASYAEEISYDLQKLNDTVMNKVRKMQFATMETSVEDPVHYFWPIFEQANYKYKIYRNACTVFLLIGFLLFLWVALENIFIAIGFMIK